MKMRTACCWLSLDARNFLLPPIAFIIGFLHWNRKSSDRNSLRSIMKPSPKLVSAFAFLFMSFSAVAADGGYHQVAKYDVGGDGGWDYLTVDDSSNRLFISRGTHVMVLDINTG